MCRKVSAVRQVHRGEPIQGHKVRGRQDFRSRPDGSLATSTSVSHVGRIPDREDAIR